MSKRGWAGAFINLVLVAELAVFLLSVVLACGAQMQSDAASNARMQKAYRFQKGGWTYVHLEG